MESVTGSQCQITWTLNSVNLSRRFLDLSSLAEGSPVQNSVFGGIVAREGPEASDSRGDSGRAVRAQKRNWNQVFGAFACKSRPARRALRLGDDDPQETGSSHA
jgi:hypothetical protein